MGKFVAYFFISFLASLALTPVARKLAVRLNMYAHPNHRTSHNGAVPKFGGLAIIFAFVLGLAVAFSLDKSLFAGEGARVGSLVLGALLIFLTGALDDKLELNCNVKLVIELVVASLAFRAGWRVETILLPAAMEIHLGIFSYFLSVFWMVGVINAFNLIDGLDGLAAGIALVVSFVMISIAALFGNSLVALISLLLAGAVLGFLRYNINPASIFMGDSGSLSLGFIISCLSIEAASVQPGRIAFLVPFLLLGIPITDTLLAIVRRLRKGIHPFHADQEHIHHRLVKLGLSQPGAAMFIVGMSLILAIMAFLIAQGIHTDVEMYSQLLEKLR